MSMLFKRIKDWAVSITSFRTGDVLPVDGPSGTVKIPYSDLAKEVIKDSANNTAATEADLVSGSALPIMTANGPKSLPGNTIAKASEQTALTTYAQNVASSVAPPFDPTRTSENQYKAGEIVTYTDGKSYRFNVDHYGAWNADDVERYDAGESLKFFVVTDNPEYIYAITDKDGVFLFGVKKDGSVEWQKGVPEPIQNIIDEIKLVTDKTKIVSNPEYVYAVTDSEDRFLFGVKPDGSFEWAKGIPQNIQSEIESLYAELDGKVDKEDGKALIDAVFAGGVGISENPEYVYAVTDSNGKFLFGVKKDGNFVWAKTDLLHTDKEINPEFTYALTDSEGKTILGLSNEGLFRMFAKVRFEGGIEWTDGNLTDLEQALKAHGFSSGQGDWSDSKSVSIPKPKFAIINFSGIESMPTTKTEDAHAYMQFWDCNGNYFKKKVIANAQGNSSLQFVKKNVGFDICNDVWVGDDTFKLKFGDWVPQDSFHLKAYYTDFFRGLGLVCYDFYKEILDTRPTQVNRTWKMALPLAQDTSNVGEGLGYGATTKLVQRIDDGALCFPQGFPCAVYLNGSFYGLFCFQLKKHRDNYMMEKDNKKHIHLDGTLSTNFFGGTINWTQFEVRNPKSLYCMDGSKYDGDNPKELIDPTSASYDPNNSKHVTTYAVKQSIIALANVYSLVSAAATETDKKAIIEEYFDVDNLIDYQVFGDLIYNLDGFAKNWQWTTWDCHKWYVNAYDLDMAMGASFKGDAVHVPVSSHIGNSNGLPSKYILQYYSSELEERYAELRRAGIADVTHFVNLLSEFTATIGNDFFKAEYEKWNDSPCNRDMVVNTDYWSLKLDGGKPVIEYTTSDIPIYDGNTTYSPGDEVRFNPTEGDNPLWYYVFTCTAGTTGNVPSPKAGFRDNIWRVKNWLARTISNMDTLYNYNYN